MEPRRKDSLKRFDSFIKNQTALFRPQFDSSYDFNLIDQKAQKMWELMAEYTPTDKETIQKKFVDHLEYTLAKTRYDFDRRSAHRALAYSIRDRLIESNNDTQSIITIQNPKRVYYLSIEFLLGRLL